MNTTLESERLLLRPPTQDDVPAFTAILAADRLIAENTFVPHPYLPEHAQQFMTQVAEWQNRRTGGAFALLLKHDQTLIGMMGLHIKQEHNHAVTGYWLDQAHRGQGYTTEALRRLLVYAFEDLGLNRVYAEHFVHNPASGRVMLKAGMQYEGLMRQHVYHALHDALMDVHQHGITRADYVRQKTTAAG